VRLFAPKTSASVLSPAQTGISFEPPLVMVLEKVARLYERATICFEANWVLKKEILNKNL
jgi:hypothetical protein